MTTKEAIVKYITEMNSDMLYLLLDDNKSYMDVPKKNFIAKLEKIFQSLKDKNINQFDSVVNGHCGGTCNNGCGGYSFLTVDNQSLDLLFEEEDSKIKDIYKCQLLINEPLIENKNKIHFSFYDDEKTNYIPSKRDLYLQNQIKTAFSEFHQFKNDVTDLETFCNWSLHVDNLFEDINIYERHSLQFTRRFIDLAIKNLGIDAIIKLYPRAKKAMNEYSNLDISNESELIEWALKYEENALYYGIYERVENWEQNNLILHPLDNSIVIDCTKYAASLHFSVIHPKHYYEFYKKYSLSSIQFNEAIDEDDEFQVNLISNLHIHEAHQDLLVCKTYYRPIYLEYIIGLWQGSDQFIEVAGKELGINVKLEFFGTIYSYIDKNGKQQLKQTPQLKEAELQNEKANQFYTEEIGPDWKLKLHNRIKELYNEFKM